MYIVKADNPKKHSKVSKTSPLSHDVNATEPRQRSSPLPFTVSDEKMMKEQHGNDLIHLVLMRNQRETAAKAMQTMSARLAERFLYIDIIRRHA